MLTWLAIRSTLGRLASAVPIWAWIMVAALAWGAWQHHRATAAGAAQLKAERSLSDLRAAAAKAAIDELARQVVTQTGVVNVAHDQTAQARADAAAADDAVRRLRQRAATPGRASAAPAAAAGSSPAGDGPDLCADVRGRLAAAVGELAARGQRLAEIADQRGIAGKACERIDDGAMIAGPGLKVKPAAQ